MSQNWSLDLFPSDNEDDIVYVVAKNGTDTLFGVAKIRHRKKGVSVTLSQWETPDGAPVDDKNLTNRAIDLVRDSSR